ncbi:hypothetical protein OPV22_015230 [Ensete ventricosum]|uniref:Uncharacterized protein n=1 Tax=Ensete ventricosum TaxID=4639 RepID=A0AAV8PL85_ENSVE|nr:hypothetical protein OPV22_015230 [Ensete ventricosum]
MPQSLYEVEEGRATAFGKVIDLGKNPCCFSKGGGDRWTLSARQRQEGEEERTALKAMVVEGRVNSAPALAIPCLPDAIAPIDGDSQVMEPT